MINSHKQPVDSTADKFQILLDLVSNFLDHKWHTMLVSLSRDVVYEGVTYLGFKNAPAAKGNHHHYVGGLVDHILEMWDIHQNIAGPVGAADPRLMEHRVLAGIILHDLHKAWCNFVLDGSLASGVNYGKHPSSSLLTADQKTVYIAGKYVDLDIIQLNSVYHSEGGWAASPPKWSTPLAKYLYLLDELSSNVKNRLALSLPESDISTLVYADRGVTLELAQYFDLVK